MRTAFEPSFIRKISICTLAAYLAATVPQTFVDPLLEHHIYFGARSYPYALWLIPLAAVTFIFTYISMMRTTKIGLNILPFLVATTVSIPIFVPEVPHGNLVTVGFVWIIFLTVTLWIHNYRVVLRPADGFPLGLGDKSARIEFLKEEGQFWRMVCVGLGGGYFAIVIAWQSFLMTLNKFIVSDYAPEVFILNGMTFTLIGIVSVGLIVCPLAEALRKHRETTNSFLIKARQSGSLPVSTD